MPLTKMDTSARSWFGTPTEKSDPDEPYAVRHAVPERFEAYAKILHPIYELPDVEDRELTWDEWERARWEEEKRQGSDTTEGIERELRKLRTWRSFPDSYEGAEQVSWRDLTERYGMAYVPELDNWSFKSAFGDSWPRYLAGAHEGELDPREALALLDILRPHAKCKCRFWFCWADTWTQKDYRADGVAEGDLFDLPRAMVDREARWPTAIWPVDESWFVCSDPDLDFTLVGGPRSLIDEILDTSKLEAFQVSPSMRIDRYADTANA